MITDSQLATAMAAAHRIGAQDRANNMDCVHDSGITAKRAIFKLNQSGERDATNGNTELSTTDLADAQDFQDIHRYYRHGYANVPMDRIPPLD